MKLVDLSSPFHQCSSSSSSRDRQFTSSSMQKQQQQMQQQQMQQQQMQMQRYSQRFVSIALSGAELADLDLTNLELFLPSSAAAAAAAAAAWDSTPVATPVSTWTCLDNATRVELRSKSGVASTRAAAGAAAAVAAMGFLSGDYATSSSSSSNEDSSSWASWDSERKLRCLDSSSCEAPAIVLRSRSVMESIAAAAAADSATKKKRAVSMDEASLRLASSAGRRRQSPVAAARNLPQQQQHQNAKKSQPLPLPLPPPLPDADESSMPRRRIAHHRRHLSIDLRGSPAAKFLVELMPWELPAKLRLMSDGVSDGSSATPPPAAVPFQWEEAPGKPKIEPAAGAGGGAKRLSFDRPLRLPPRLVLHGDSIAVSKSPTSILEAAAESTSSASPKCENPSPQLARASLHGRMRAFFAWFVLGRKKPKEQSRADADFYDDEDAEFDLQNPQFDLRDAQWSRKRRNSRMRVVPMKKSKKRASSSAAASPIFPWFDSPVHAQRSRKRQWPIHKLAAAIRRVVVIPMRRRRRLHHPKKSSMYRPLLCRVDADSAASACTA